MFSIQEVAEKTGVTAHTLRYYEKEGILPPIGRDTAGRRVYSDENLAWLELVTCLKATKMPVADIKEIVRLSIEGDGTIPTRREILVAHRKVMEAQLAELEQNISKIDKKIAFYDGADSC